MPEGEALIRARRRETTGRTYHVRETGMRRLAAELARIRRKVRRKTPEMRTKRPQAIENHLGGKTAGRESGAKGAVS